MAASLPGERREWEMTTRLVVVALVCMAILAAGTCALGEEASAKKLFALPELENVLLADRDMPGLKLLYQQRFDWAIAKPTIGEAGVENHEKVGIEQGWVSQEGRHPCVLYCALDTPEQAASAAAYHAGSQAWPFKEGLPTANVGKLGDRSWVAVQSEGAAILFVRGNFMVLVTDLVTKPQERARLEGIAKAVLVKIEKELARRKQ
jgi:hypothetical protein